MTEGARHGRRTLVDKLRQVVQRETQQSGQKKKNELREEKWTVNVEDNGGHTL